MKQEKISPNDPRLSAYAFGEMDSVEAQAFAKDLALDPEASALVEELRGFGIQLSTTLASEPEASAPAAPGEVVPFPVAQSRGARRQAFYWSAGLGLAACLTFVVLQDQGPLQTKKNMTVEKRVEEIRDGTEVSPQTKQSGASVAPAPVPSSNVVGTVMQNENASGVRSEPKDTLVEGDENRDSDVEETIELSPFVVEVEAGGGYQASQTLAGSRLPEVPDVVTGSTTVRGLGAPDLGAGPAVGTGKSDDTGFGLARKVEKRRADVGSAITVVDPKFMQDVGAGNADQLLQYTTNTETGGLQGNFAGSTKLSKPAKAQGEGYAALRESGFSLVSASPTSTFSIDVDTASYANVRRFLNQGQRPPREAVRIEEMINAFTYRYATPQGSDPVAASLEVSSAPWNPEHRLVRIGLKAREIPATERPASNLVFLIDVSGSMSSPNKLPLVQRALAMLVEQLRPQDRVAIVVYAGATGLALPSTSGEDKAEILRALEGLQSGGGTAGAMGIQLAYDVAKANFVPGGTNRVVLCTDGDFNVGVTSQTELKSLIEAKAKSGVFLTVLGFGMGNYKDNTLEMLADKGNGNYGYVDSDKEARRLLVEQAGGTLVAVAKDVKVQVEFNPGRVAAYRLIGYENRRLSREDFANDQVDAGEMGSGHTVTALYEVVPVGAAVPAVGPLEPLRYESRQEAEEVAAKASDELLTVAVRYKPVDGNESRKLIFPLVDRGSHFTEASPDFRFATAVAGFGLVLTESPFAPSLTLTQIENWARAASVGDGDAQRREFLELVRKASAPDLRAE